MFRLCWLFIPRVGSIHPKHPGLIYPINYGYIPNVLGGDGEELDVYLLGIDVPVEEYTARIIGIVHRHNDVEDKLVAAPEGFNFDQNKIYFRLADIILLRAECRARLGNNAGAIEDAALISRESHEYSLRPQHGVG